MKKYVSLFAFLWVPRIPLQTIGWLIEYLANLDFHAIVTDDLVLRALPNAYEREHYFSVKIKKNEYLELDEFLKKLHDFGFESKDFLEDGMFMRKWDTVLVMIGGGSILLTLSFWWDIVEKILVSYHGAPPQEVDTYTIGKRADLELFLKKEAIENSQKDLYSSAFFLLDNLDISPSYPFLSSFPNGVSLEILKTSNPQQVSLERSEWSAKNMDEFHHFLLWETREIRLYSKHPQSIKSFLEYNNLQVSQIQQVSFHFLSSYQTPTKVVVCDDVLSRIFAKKRLKKSLSENLDLLLSMKSGDYVVHIEHGIGIFHQIITKEHGKIRREYVEIHYAQEDKLFVPITELKRLSKYVGKENPELTNLSKSQWKNKMSKAQDDVQKTAEELLEIYAQRQIKKGFAFELDPERLKVFQEKFEYEYTPDQVLAIQDILTDMSHPLPMERLLVGDVGFWKTEVAFQAIFTAFLNKKQSVLISPLVVLAYEHYQKACERFTEFGVRVQVLTRFESMAEATIIQKQLKEGKIDLIIGTHRLLSDEITFRDLWLLIIDEEHKFGVKEKEKIKSYQGHIDILSLSATPIPRSLNLALGGIKDVSLLSYPPSNRKGVDTSVCQFDDLLIKEASLREFSRGGQVFFVHNRVATIEAMYDHLANLLPKKKIVITHGQLPWHELEDRILSFKRKEYDILLSSTVIENGIDFSNVNTIFINDAHKFGISQIHQLRGRVGRSDKRGYCYLLFARDKIKEDGAKRLSTMVEYSHLWAGFELAVKDLEMRWGWDILGIRQSGLSSEIGMTLYLKMLDEKVSELKELYDAKHGFGDSTPKRPRIDTTIDLLVWASLGDDYFASELDKINFYREIESVDDLDDLEHLMVDFSQLHTDFTQENRNLFHILKVRILANAYKVLSIKRSGVSYEIRFHASLTVAELKDFLALDRDVRFVVQDLWTLKTPCNSFSSDEAFLEFLLNLFEPKKPERKIVKLKKN